MMGMFIAFVSTTLGRIVVGALSVLAFWASVKFYYEGKGASKAVAKIERSNNVAARNARIGAAGVTNAAVSGVLDPNTVNE